MEKTLSLQLEEMEAVQAPGWADISIGVIIVISITGLALT